jgi:3-mercaptopyruvate sulfurtransferase SseA
VAQQLQKLGIMHVRPLQGGFAGWKDLGYPLADPTDLAWVTATLRCTLADLVHLTLLDFMSCSAWRIFSGLPRSRH